jgi:hypothetical protein
MPRVDDFKNTLVIAREEFQRKDPKIMARDSGAVFQVEPKGAVLVLPFINREIKISWPEGGVITLPDCII